jgi:hypothetical protein
MKRIYGKTPLERLLEHSVTLENGCVEYQGARNKLGYARIKVDKVNVGVHRLSYEVQVGPIPEGYVLDHLCRNPSCINPAHLEPVPQSLNLLRGYGIGVQNSMKDTCRNGHPYTPETMHIERGKYRRCVVCRRLRERTYPYKCSQKRTA